MLTISWIENPQIEVLGFYIPWIWVIGAAGFLFAWATISLMEHLNWTRHIWHLPLFFLALSVIFGSILGFLLAP